MPARTSGADRRVADIEAAHAEAIEVEAERVEVARRLAEGPLERADRHLGEVLNELRVAQTGVQLLFGFLLSLAFTGRFGQLDHVQRLLYLASFLLSLLTAVLMMAPAAIRRITFRQQGKAETVHLVNQIFNVSLCTLALTLCGAVDLLLDVVVGRVAGFAAGVVTMAVVVLTWLVLPYRVLRTAKVGPTVS